MHSRIIPTAVVTIALLAASALPVPAQTTSKDVAQKASETGEAIKDYTIEKKNEAVAQAKKLTADLDAKIKDLEAEASKQTGEAKTKAQAQLRDLKAKRAAASRKASDLGKATKASWERAKEGFADAYRDLATAYEKAAAEFKK
jgi:Spy/CpxP family protein refolding chaperone